MSAYACAAVYHRACCCAVRCRVREVGSFVAALLLLSGLAGLLLLVGFFGSWWVTPFFVCVWGGGGV